MDDRSEKEEGVVDVDLESGLALTEDASNNFSTPQGKTFFAKISCGFVGDSIKGEDKHSVYLNESNLGRVSVDMVNVTNKLLMGQDLVKSVEHITPAKEKHKKSSSSNKKAARPPRPPRSPSLDAADHKLIREITELAMLKRARIDRMKALKKMKAAKSSSSSSGSSMLAMVFTVVFCIVIILQGMSPGKSSVASFQGSPVSTGGAEGSLIAVQHHLNPSSNDQHAPASESHKILQHLTGSDLPLKLRSDEG